MVTSRKSLHVLGVAVTSCQSEASAQRHRHRRLQGVVEAAAAAVAAAKQAPSIGLASTAGLEEPNAKGKGREQGQEDGEAAAEAGVDNMQAGGFFARFGREREGPRPTVIPPAARGGPPTTPVPAEVAAANSDSV